MIARVFVKKKTKSNETFDYLINTGDKVEKLSLVEVPFRNIKAIGLVESIAKSSSFAKKRIIRILTKSSIFTQDQVKLAKMISEEGLSTFAESIFSFLPPLNLKDLSSLGFKARLKKNLKNTKQLFIAPFSQRVELYCQKISRMDSGQNLIVCPTIFQINRVLQTVKKISPNTKVFLWHSSLPKNDRAKVWQKLLEGEPMLVIGTRQSLLLPYVSLKNIFIDDPKNFAYQEDQAPYYNAFFVARNLSNILKSNLVIGEETPDIISYIGILKRELAYSEQKTNLKISVLPSWQRIIQKGSLDQIINRDLSKKIKVAVIGPWKNFHRTLCLDCQKNLLCPACESAFFDENGTCAVCLKKAENNFCQNCGSVKLKKNGFSKEEILEQLKKNISNPSIIFCVLTPAEIESKSDSFNLAILPYFQQMLNLPYLRVRQKLFNLIRGLKSRNVDEVFLCGDNISDLDFVRQLKLNDWDGFLKNELSERKKLGLPPFTTAFLIYVKKNKSQNAEKILNDFSQKIQNFAKISNLPEDNDSFSALVIATKQNLPKLKKSFLKNQNKLIYIKPNPIEYS